MSSGAPEVASGSALGPADDRPLNDQEFQLLQRLLSDPFSFPAAYKAWLISYLETSDLNLPISSVNGLLGILGISGLGGGTLGIFPAGIILPYGGAAAPTGSKLCDGAAYDTVLEARLFAAIGYNYGGSSGTFNVPDYRGRVPVGLGPHADVNALNKNDGLPVASRSPIHNSHVNDPTHAHAVSDPTHSHGVSDPSHSHGVNDPQHAHTYTAPTSSGGGIGGTGPFTFPSGGTAFSYTGVTIQGSSTGIGIAGAATGIGVAAAASGVSVGPGGTRPDDTPAFETCNFIIIS